MNIMKKFSLMLLCVVGLAFTACEPNVENLDPSKLDDTTERCWAITYTLYGVSATTYTWGTEAVIAYSVKESQELVGVGKYSYEEANANDAEACHDLNDDNY